jgi:uncharacterized protein YcbX
VWVDLPPSATVDGLQLALWCCLTPSAISVLRFRANIWLSFGREWHEEKLLAIRCTDDNARRWVAKRGGAGLQLDKGPVHCSACC